MHFDYIQCEKCCPGSGKLKGHRGRHCITPKLILKGQYQREKYLRKRKRSRLNKV